MSTPSVGKLGEPYTNLPPIYQTQSFNEDAFKQAELKSKYGTLASKRDVKRFNRYMKSDAGVKALETAKTAHNAAEHQKWSSSYSDYAAAIAAQSKARMLAAKADFYAPVEEIPSTPALVLKDAARWNQVASKYGFKDYNDVAAWQKENGLEADGKFGAASYAKWAQLNPDKVETVPAIRAAANKTSTVSTNNTTNTTTTTSTSPVDTSVSDVNAWAEHLRKLGYEETLLDDGSSVFSNNGIDYYNNGKMRDADGTMSGYMYKHLPDASTKSTTSSTTSKPTYYTYQQVLDMDQYRAPRRMTHYVTINGKKYPIIVTKLGVLNSSDLKNDHSYAYDASTGNMIELMEDWTGAPKIENGTAATTGDWRSLVTFRKQGGTMNKINYFQQGGTAPQQQDMQAQVVALVQAAMQGDQKATETVNKIMEAAKAGDKQAMQIAQMIQQVAQKMQGQATAAKWGSKLNYIRSLKFAKGGKACP